MHSMLCTPPISRTLSQVSCLGFRATSHRLRQECAAPYCSAALNVKSTSSSQLGNTPATWQSKRTFRSSPACSKKDYYDVLGVKKSASKDEIKSKYRELAKKCHPDLNKDDKNAATKFRELSEAYEVLENDSKRQTYDTYGSVDQNGGGGQQGNPFEGFSGFGGFGGFSGFPGGGFRQAQGEPGEDIFDVLNRAMRKQEESMGKDVRMKLRLSFLEAVNGCNKDIKYDYMEPDPANSKNSKRQTKSVNIDIPPGVETGVSIKMGGQGIKAIKGSHIGNLLIELQVDDDPYFQRVSSDIYTDQHITMMQAALGDTIDVLTLDGMVEMKIKPGTQSGTKLSLTAKGVKHLNESMVAGSRRGKHYVTLVVMTPTNMTEKQEELLKQYHELENAKGKEEKSTWSKKISLDLDKAWSRLKSFAGQSQS